MSWTVIVQQLVTAFAALAGMWLNSRLSRKSRKDTLALKLLEAKLRAYEVIAEPLEDAYLSVGQEIHQTVPLPEASQKFWKLRKAQLPYAHLLSGRVVETFNALYRLHSEISRKPADGHDPGEEHKRLNEIIQEIWQAIREDCGTDRLAKHVQETLAPFALPFLGEKDTPKPVGKEAPARY